MVLPPVVMGLLLGSTVFTGLAVVIRARGFARATGLLILASAAAYLLVLFANPGNAVVTRRLNGPNAVSAPLGSPISRLRLVDFNVLHGYPSFDRQEERYRLLAAALEALDPTVIVLQEVYWTADHPHLAERLGADLGLDVAYARANGSRHLLGFEEGSAVLSRLPIVKARSLVLSPRRPPWESRLALVVEIATGGDSTLVLAGTHLTHRGKDVAVAQAHDLLARLPEPTAIVAGDLNATDGGTLRAFEEHGFVDVLPGGIDHVLVRGSGGNYRDWRVVRAEWTLRPQDLAVLVGEAATISDHPGIVVDLVAGR